MSWKIEFYQTGSGDCPVKVFIESQNKQTIAKIVHYLELLESYGPFLKPPYVKKSKKTPKKEIAIALGRLKEII